MFTAAWIQSALFCGNIHCPFVYSTDPVYLVDCVDLICILYNWWKGFSIPFLSHSTHEAQLWFYPPISDHPHEFAPEVALRTWALSWVRTECGAGAIAWIMGTLGVPGIQGSQRRGRRRYCAIRIFSSLWKLAFKGPPWLVLLYFLEHQALKSHLSGIFINRLPSNHIWGEKGNSDRSTAWAHDSTVAPCLHGCVPFLKGIPHHRLLSPILLSHLLQSTGILALGLLSNPYAPAPSRYPFPWTWVLFWGIDCPHSSHSIQTVTDQPLHSPTAAWLTECPDTGPPPHRVQVCSLSSSFSFPSFILSNFVDLYITFQRSGTPCQQLVLMRSSSISKCSWCIHVERRAHVHLRYSILSLSHTNYILSSSKETNIHWFDFNLIFLS